MRDNFTKKNLSFLLSKEEGDAFRRWVNDNYPDYARSIKLDRSGGYDNSYIKKAWRKHGAEYEQSQSGKGKGIDVDQALDIGGKVVSFFSQFGDKKKRTARRSSRKKKGSSRKKMFKQGKLLGINPFKMIKLMQKAKKSEVKAMIWFLL